MAFASSLEIVIKDFNCSEISPLVTGLPSKYSTTLTQESGCLSISKEDFEFQDWFAFNNVACEFIDDLKTLAPRIALEEPTLRIAIYYNINETVVLPLKLSKELIKRVSDMSLSLDITGYPCADEAVGD